MIRRYTSAWFFCQTVLRLMPQRARRQDNIQRRLPAPGGHVGAGMPVNQVSHGKSDPSCPSGLVPVPGTHDVERPNIGQIISSGINRRG